MAKGPELDDQNKPWVWTEDGRPTEHDFKGYSLDAKRQPTFEYQFDSVVATDFFEPVKGDQKTQIRRRVTLTSAEERKGLRFRLGASKKIEQMGERVFAIGKLKVRVESGPEAKVVDAGDGQSLELRFDLSANQKVEFVVDYLWD